VGEGNAVAYPFVFVYPSKGLAMSSTPIAVGQPAPDFSLPAHIGVSPVRLSALRGRVVVLVFYPLDFTGT
jgi:hypothetical protein